MNRMKIENGMCYQLKQNTNQHINYEQVEDSNI